MLGWEDVDPKVDEVESGYSVYGEREPGRLTNARGEGK